MSALPVCLANRSPYLLSLPPSFFLSLSLHQSSRHVPGAPVVAERMNGRGTTEGDWGSLQPVEADRAHASHRESVRGWRAQELSGSCPSLPQEPIATACCGITGTHSTGAMTSRRSPPGRRAPPPSLRDSPLSTPTPRLTLSGVVAARGGRGGGQGPP